MKIKFTNIKIENFKNIELLETTFGEKTLIYGANETGKTSFADAISWCLTGKNSLGDSQFNFVPIGKTGVSPSVTLEIDISGKVKDMADHCVLRRVYLAKQNRSKEFTGEYQTVCYVNGLKVGVKEFDKWIENHICDSEIFRLIHDVRYFTENIATNGRERPWEAQRRLLFSISGIKSDLELARSKKRFEPILNGMQRYDTANQYLTFLKAEEKRIEDEIRYHNARIELFKNTFGDCEDCNEDLEGQIKSLKLEATNLDTQIEQEQKTLREKRAKKLNEYKKLYDEKVAEFKNAQNVYSEKFDELNLKGRLIGKYIINLQTEIAKFGLQLDEAKKAYNNIDVQCPTCGQYMPTEIVEKERNRLETKIGELQEHINLLKKEEEEKRKGYKETEEEISGLKAPTYPEELRDIQKNINAMNVMETDSEASIQIKNKREKLIEKLNSLQEKRYEAERNKKAKEAMEEIESKVSELLDMRANNRRLLDLTKDFINAKCVYVEKKINSLFDGINFSMFKKNKTNEEVQNCCELRWNGVLYQDLSYSTKFVVSLKIVMAFQKFYNVIFPCIVDNSESIDFEQECNNQMIFLIKEDENCPDCGSKVGRKKEDGYWHCPVCNTVFKKKLEVRFA